MSNVYIIAGPPGVGKSTLGHRFIPPDLDILNEDEMRYKYKAKGYVDYNEYSIHRVLDTIRRKLIDDEDFALELNLGFSHQYEYALSLKRFQQKNRLNVVLFFTDDLELCKDRARARYESGRHLVEPGTIEEMYANTLPLLKDNLDAVDYLMLVDVNRLNELNPIGEYFKDENRLSILDNRPIWSKDNLLPFIYSYINTRDLYNNPFDPDEPDNDFSQAYTR